MKKIYFFILLGFFSPSLFAQTLFTFGNSNVDKEEFLRAYNKNKTTAADKEKSLREYLDLYIKFKLKVKAARDLRLDTLPQLKIDLESFKSQIEETYMNNEPAINGLIDEAFTRSQKDIHVIHFFIPLDDKMNPADTLNAYKALDELRAQIKNTNDYEQPVKLLAEKYKTIKGTDLGFITVFSLPYVYENIVYGLNAGETSKNYRSLKGLHFFKLVEERKSAGRWKIAQILFAIPPGDEKESFVNLKKKADSVYRLLKKGGDFAQLALEYSDDKMTYMTGGEIPEFGTGKFDLPFEAEVFKLIKEGEISSPFASSFGYHIVKKLSQTPTPAVKEDVVFMADLKQKVIQDSRIANAKDIFYKDILKKISLKKNTGVKEADLFRYADSISANPQTFISAKTPIFDKVILTIGKNGIKGGDWLIFIRDYKASEEKIPNESNAALYEKFIKTTVLGYYKKNMEEYNPDFKYQMDEFRDGNILFEIMEKNVWSNAANDSVGLLKYYNQYKTKYVWAKSANIIIFNSTNKATAEEAIAGLKSGRDWKEFIEDKKNMIQADSGRFEISQIPMENVANPLPGLITTPLINATDGSASFIKFINIYESGVQRSFDEARGLVINDYQTVLEEKWIEGLKKKYPVKVNEEVFSSLLK